MPRVLNLQFFQGEKTEKATPKKRRDARKKGQVVQSKDISAAISLLVIFLVIGTASKYFIDAIYELYYISINAIENFDEYVRMATLNVLGLRVMMAFIKIVAPIILTVLLIGVITSYMQVGFLFTVEPLKFKFDKINPLQGFKKIFSLKSFVEMVKSILKAAGLLLLSYQYLVSRQNEVFKISTLNLTAGVALLWDVVVGVIVRCAAYLLVLAIADYAYKRWDNERQLKMSKQEVKEEYKQMEGDPFIRSKIKEKQRQMAMSRMMQDVPNADVVITNPTHYAIALSYDQAEAYAPKVIAKGKDIIAANVKRIARDAGVPVVENKQLARALYQTTDVGQYIPADLFEAVADVLAYVYRLNNRSI